MIYQVHHLNCGSFCPYCAPLFGQRGLKAELVCHCLLVETDQGLVLIDTGFGTQDYLHSQKRLGSIISKFGAIQHNFNLTAISQIQKLGFKPSDVQHILVTHLDFDHAGGISDFPHATVHILSSEFNATQNHHYKSKIRYKNEQFKQHRYWNFIEPLYGEHWFNLQQVQGFKLFQDEILMIPLLGHTEGHCGIAIKQNQQWLLFCGDAYYSHRQLDPSYKSPGLELTERLFAHNNLQRIQSLQQIQQLALNQPKINIMCSHDPVELKREQGGISC